MSYTLKEFEEYLKKINPGKYDNNESNIYPAVGKAATSKLSSAAPKVPTQSDTVRPWDVDQTENPFYTGSQNSGIISQDNGANGIIGNTQTPQYGTNANNSNNDPYAIPWTKEQETSKRLSDLKTQRENFNQTFVGIPTTEELMKLSAYDNQIAKLQGQLGVGNATNTQNAAAPLGQGFMDDVVNREQEIADQAKPSVPTMTEPIPEYNQPEETVNSDPYAIQEPRQVPYTNPYDIPEGYNPNDYVYPTEEKPVYTNPYDIPWTEEQEKKKRLQDLTIERENFNQTLVGMPTTQDLVKLGALDDEIVKLTQELGLGQKEYTPGVEGGWQEETKPAPYTPNVEGGDIGDVASQGVNVGGGIDDMSNTGKGNAPGGGGGGSWGDDEESSSIFDDIADMAEDVWGSLKDIGENAANQVAEATKWGVNALNTLYDMGVDVSEAAYTAVMEQINTTGDALEAVKDVVVNEFNSQVNKAMEDLQDAMVEKGPEFHDFAFNNSWDTELVKELSNALLIKLEGGWKLFDSTEEKLGHTYVSEKEYNEAENPDEKLDWNRTWSERVDELSTNPDFNTTGIVNKQDALGSESYGSQGNASNNCCGSAAVQNALVCMGKSSNYSEVYATFDDDDMLLGQGTCGTNPVAVIEYLENEGLEVAPVLPSPETMTEPGVSIYVYMWENESGQRSFHYMTAESDGNKLLTYNSEGEYDISNLDVEDESTFGPIEDLINDKDMIMWMQLKIE